MLLLLLLVLVGSRGIGATELLRVGGQMVALTLLQLVELLLLFDQ